MTDVDQGAQEYRPGTRVIAYGKHPGVIVGERLNFSAYNVKTDPILSPGYKRRRRVTIVVHESHLEREER